MQTLMTDSYIYAIYIVYEYPKTHQLDKSDGKCANQSPRLLNILFWEDIDKMVEWCKALML